MEKLNKIMTFAVAAALVVAVLMSLGPHLPLRPAIRRTTAQVVAVLKSWGRQPEPVTDSWFRQAVLDSSQPVVVKFGAEWCGPCRGMDAAMDTLQPQYASRAKFLKIDIDKTPNLFAHYRSGRGIPQIMIFREGRIIAQQKGFGGEDGLKQWLENSL
jgi:thioredoxin 1